MPDALLVDSIIGYFLKHADDVDYVTNALKTTYPPGAEVSVYPASVLYDAERHATDAKLREHVGIHIYQHPERYRVRNLEAPAWLHCPDLHLEVDTDEDFEVVREIFEALHPANPGFSLWQAIQFATGTGLADRNKDVERRWYAFRQDAKRG